MKAQDTPPAYLKRIAAIVAQAIADGDAHAEIEIAITATGGAVRAVMWHVAPVA